MKRGKAKFDTLNDTILSAFFSFFSTNTILTVISRISQRFTTQVNVYLQETCTVVSINLPKVETIRKENKSIDDLLAWNREVTTLVSNMPNAHQVEITCEDFKIFNPLNDKLVQNTTFPYIHSLTAGVFDEERFTRFIGPQNVLSTMTLRDVTLKFSVLSINAADLLVRFFRESTTHQMDYRSDINVTRLRLEY